MKTYKGKITELSENGIFVFGSNTEGRHGKGAALIAKQKFGAIYGQPKGLQGKSYAIVTKDLTKPVHPSVSEEDIVRQISELYIFAAKNKDKDFYIAYSGEGVNLNAYTPNQMAGFFRSAGLGLIPENVVFEEEFSKLVRYE